MRQEADSPGPISGRSRIVRSMGRGTVAAAILAATAGAAGIFSLFTCPMFTCPMCPQYRITEPAPDGDKKRDMKQTSPEAEISTEPSDS
jgi:hypothetical protein